MQIIVNIDNNNGAMGIKFSNDYKGDPIADITRVQFALLNAERERASQIKKPSAQETIKLAGVK